MNKIAEKHFYQKQKEYSLFLKQAKKYIKKHENKKIITSIKLVRKKQKNQNQKILTMIMIIRKIRQRITRRFWWGILQIRSMKD